MKWQLLSSWMAVVLNLYCTDPSQQTYPDQREIKTAKVSKTKPGSSFSDTIEINLPSAIFYNPDSMQLE